MNTTTPSFFEPQRFDQLYLPRYNAIAEAAAAQPAQPASDDTERIAVFGIDCQIGFSNPSASLFVPGAVEDMKRGATFILNNLTRITSLIFSLDTHRAYQVFHPAFWSDRDGNSPQPMTVISANDVASGVWVPAQEPERVLQYCRQLEETGRFILTVWPYHTMLGSPDHALVPALFEVALFHSLVRQTQIVLETKGEHPLTENYSVLEPEVKTIGDLEVGTFNQPLFDKLMAHDRVYVWGEASSHCVASTLRSIQSQLEHLNRSDLLSKIYILEDCMSPVPAVCDSEGKPLPGLDFPSIAKECIAQCAAAGMKVVQSSDGIGR